MCALPRNRICFLATELSRSVNRFVVTCIIPNTCRHVSCPAFLLCAVYCGSDAAQIKHLLNLLNNEHILMINTSQVDPHNDIQIWWNGLMEHFQREKESNFVIINNFDNSAYNKLSQRDMNWICQSFFFTTLHVAFIVAVRNLVYFI